MYNQSNLLNSVKLKWTIFKVKILLGKICGPPTFTYMYLMYLSMFNCKDLWMQFCTHSCFAITVKLYCYFAITVILYFFVISPGEGSRGPADVPALSVSTGTADRRPGVLQGLLVISSRVKSHKGWTLKEIWALDQSMSDINLFILFIYFFTWDHLFCCLLCVSGVCVLIVSL